MPEKLHPTISKPSKLEQVLVGSWNAVKPEGQGKHILEWYDKIKFPPKTREELKVADKVHVFLKNNPKLIGWGAIATEAALLAGVVAGFRKIRRGKSVNSIADEHVGSVDSPKRKPRAIPQRIKEPPDRVYSVLPGTLVPKDRDLAIWPDANVWITNYMGAQQLRRPSYQGYDDAEHTALKSLEFACRGFDPVGCRENSDGVAWNAGTIAAFLLDADIIGKQELLEQVLPLSAYGGEPLAAGIDRKLGLAALQRTFANWLGSPGRGGDPERIFDYWGDTLWFAGLHLLLPSEYEVRGIHRLALSSHMPRAMNVLRETYLKHHWIPR